MERYCKSLTQYVRRQSIEVRIGSVAIGGDNPVAPQSMTDCSTMDTAACIAQIGRIRAAGCRIVRLTVQNSREAENLKNIVTEAKKQGFGDVAIVADIHFAPEVALLAAEFADKVRINPGNFGRGGDHFVRLIKRCKARQVPIRIGVNHGSLASHIVEKWGDTPRGMVESAMEYLRVCREWDFDQVVVSMKSSNVRVMVQAYRLLVAVMDNESMYYPLHLGVTEAGDGAHGRIKSGVGIGALMADGLGDTIRVSLTEPPENEISVANAIILYYSARSDHKHIEPVRDESLYNPYEYRRRKTLTQGDVGGGNIPILWDELDDKAQYAVENGDIVIIEAISDNAPSEWRARMLNMEYEGDNRAVILHRKYHESSIDTLQIKAAADFGMLFIDGFAEGIRIENENATTTATATISAGDIKNISLSILQAARVRMSSTEYIACPGCGRTSYDLHGMLATIRERTSHLAGLKIGIMGCIVNGPGEMADADYGYVGEGGGRITLYKGREVVKRSIPQAEAIEELIAIIKENGDWHES